MLNLPFSKTDLKSTFGTETLALGRRWVRRNRIKALTTSQDGRHISAYVEGVDVMPCGVQIEIFTAGKIVGLCSCCLDHSHCQHVAAVLLETLQKAAAPLTLAPLSAKTQAEIKSLTLLMADEDDDWYGEFESTNANWFNLELGVMVNGKPINLLPLVSHLVKTHLAEGKPFKLDPKQDYAIALDPKHCVTIPGERLQTILNVLTELFDPRRDKTAEFLVPNLRAAQLVSLKKQFKITHWRWHGDDFWRQLGEKLRDFVGIQAATLPSGFNTQLRPYQQQGLDWLQFLREYQLGGILADDMGLGKTVQVLAHLWVEYCAQRLTLPSLIIAPTSLLTNWRMEIHKFAPKFKVLVLHGQQRLQDFGRISKFDLILSTYPLVVRDQGFLMKQRFYLLILDEAQMIKNPRAKATRVLQNIRAQHRLCLTGTPMENHLIELWSQFNFLLPGFLGTHKQYQRLYQVPIEHHNDQERLEALNQRIAPFMLRRTKQAVVKELPRKTEAIRCVTLAQQQRDLYESIRTTLLQKISETMRTASFGRSRMIVLDALLKLRQTCCDPRLLKLEAAKGMAESAKLELLMQMLPSLLEEGRSILLFSAFAQMLALIEEEIIKLGIDYVKLTGQTQDRATPIEQFQQGKVKLFLISLKAGGIGLNLTAADTVIHYDPWWNPAAEMQATDRAYRIGQDKPVLVYKLITEGTVEEKILQLQDKKRDLMESLFSEKTASKAALTLKDLDFLF